MKVYIDAGHGGRDSGAVKYLREKDVNLTMALAARDYLKLYGVQTKMSRTKDVDTDLNKICAECNEWGADYAISCHNNAGGGDGFEILYQMLSALSKRLAKNIESEVKKLGQNSRGLKTRKHPTLKNKDYFAFNRLIKCPSVICEGVFVDNKTDVKIADTLAEQRLFGYAYARGVLNDAGVKIKTVYETQYTLNFRKEANLKCDTMGVIPKGTLLTGTTLSDGWLKTTYKGKTGYVRVKGQKVYAKKV